MEASSTNSVTSARRNTGKTGNLTADQALEILQEAVLRCELAGIKVHAAPFYSQGQQSVIIVLTDVKLDGGNMMLAKG